MGMYTSQFNHKKVSQCQLVFCFDGVQVMLTIKTIFLDLWNFLSFPSFLLFGFSSNTSTCTLSATSSTGEPKDSFWGQWESLNSMSAFANLILEALCFIYDFQKWQFAKYLFVRQKFNTLASCHKWAFLVCHTSSIDVDPVWKWLDVGARTYWQVFKHNMRSGNLPMTFCLMQKFVKSFEHEEMNSFPCKSRKRVTMIPWSSYHQSLPMPMSIGPVPAPSPPASIADVPCLQS